MTAPIINPLYASHNNLWEWPLNATEGLIKRRCFYKEEFFTTRLQDQGELWILISNFIFNTYFINTTSSQCWQKWNSILHGYRNLKCLNNDNLKGYQTFTPSYYDQHFYDKMSDEFWINPSNYLFNWFFI